jgi:hypothetical protein
MYLCIYVSIYLYAYVSVCLRTLILKVLVSRIVESRNVIIWISRTKYRDLDFVLFEEFIDEGLFLHFFIRWARENNDDFFYSTVVGPAWQASFSD